jgi:hypothetical protein
MLVQGVELRKNNLYANGELITFEEDGEQILVRELYETEGTLTDDYHTVSEGDTLYGLAWEFYKKKIKDPSKYWWLIADANNITNPLDLTDWLGQDILIPNIVTARLRT